MKKCRKEISKLDLKIGKLEKSRKQFNLDLESVDEKLERIKELELLVGVIEERNNIMTVEEAERRLEEVNFSGSNLEE